MGLLKVDKNLLEGAAELFDLPPDLVEKIGRAHV